MTRYLALFAAAAALSGCASMNASQQMASLQNAVYESNDAASAMTTSDAATAAPMPGASKQMRIYWFLGGR
jgi:hypothetical protein